MSDTWQATDILRLTLLGISSFSVSFTGLPRPCSVKVGAFGAQALSGYFCCGTMYVLFCFQMDEHRYNCNTAPPSAID